MLVIVLLSIPHQSYDAATSLLLMHAVEDVRARTERAKRSHRPVLMTCPSTILEHLIALDKLDEAARHFFECMACVYSNIPGPTESISLKPSGSKGVLKEAPSFATTSRHQHKITKIQNVLPDAVPIFQILSYNSSICFNITLHMRAAFQP
mmetsp:Transcript_1282/g.2232  ORF Transcript_1282/g.2232 Transcript_1282/m.2232 type:complete len:151 (+) Transcript_1282:94-546(+)